jgi:hypothetical protein
VPAICQDVMWFCVSDYFSGCELQSCCSGDTMDKEDQCVPEVCDEDETAGVWEGAVYSRQDYYRASRTCRMRELDEGVEFCEFCEACAIYLRKYVFDYSSAPDWDSSLDDCESPTELESKGLGWPS